MSYDKEDLIKYRLDKAYTTLNEAKNLFESGFWSGSANRLYYSCFYAVIALQAKDGVTARTHNGVRTEFFKRYIKSKILDLRFAQIYTELMSKRHENDYDDFKDNSKDEIEPLIDKAEELMKAIISF